MFCPSCKLEGKKVEMARSEIVAKPDKVCFLCPVDGKHWEVLDKAEVTEIERRKSMSLGNDVAKMYGEMGQIEQMVRSVIGEREVQDQLLAIGDEIGVMLMVWNDQKDVKDQHKPAWISKKTRDVVIDLVNVVMGRVNEQMGLPYDAMP